jgi:hypothetical protein
MKTFLALTILASVLASASSASARVPKRHLTPAEQTAETIKMNNGNWVEQFWFNQELNSN